VADVTTPPPGTSTGTNDAFALLQDQLNQWGLGSLTGWAWDQLTTNNLTPAEVSLGIQQRPEFAARFPAIEARRKAGLAPISPAEYIGLERSYRQVLQAAGVPKGFYDTSDDFTQFIANDVSPSEIDQRIQRGYVAASQAPPEVRDELARRGVSLGNLAAYYLEPDKTLPLIEQQMASAQAGAAARTTGFGQLSLAEADRLAAAGVTATQAQAGFNQLAQQHELFQQLPGEATNLPTREQGLAAQFEGNAAAQAALENEAKARRSAFGGGGGLAGGQGGIGGAGQAQNA
jgi:hypothetical protein